MTSVKKFRMAVSRATPKAILRSAQHVADSRDSASIRVISPKSTVPTKAHPFATKPGG